MVLRQPPCSRKLAELETALPGSLYPWDSWGRKWQLVLFCVIAGRASSITHSVIACVTDLAPTTRREHQRSTEEKRKPNQVS